MDDTTANYMRDRLFGQARHPDLDEWDAETDFRAGLDRVERGLGEIAAELEARQAINALDDATLAELERSSSPDAPPDLTHLLNAGLRARQEEQ